MDAHMSAATRKQTREVLRRLHPELADRLDESDKLKRLAIFGIVLGVVAFLSSLASLLGAWHV